jgi:hypothetical protein
MGDKSLLPLAKDHREKAGVKGGDKVEVTLEVDAAPREVEVSKDMAADREGGRDGACEEGLA